jgi:cystine transport system ATP-binding protein
VVVVRAPSTVRDALKRLVVEKMTMIIAAHDLKLAVAVAREGTFLNEGVVVGAGRAEAS